MPTVEVTHEPLEYELHSPTSFFRDLVLSESDPAARDRQRRHSQQMHFILAERETRARDIAHMQSIELRVNPSRFDGQGGFAAPPLWLIDQSATAPRPGRTLANMMPSFPLPAGVSEVNIPRLTVGTMVGAVADNSAVPVRDITDATTTSPVVTFAGNSDVALQLLEQSPPGAYLDALIFRDLAADYDFKLEQMLINGTGTAPQFLGVLNVTAGTGGASAVTYTDATPTVAELIPFAGQAMAQLGDARLMPPETWLMRTARQAWINVSTWPTPPLGGLLGFPIAQDNAIPATLGAAANQDAMIACRPSDMLLLESAPRFSIDFESLSGALGAGLQMRGYVAAFVARYPTAIATVTGTGLIVQPGY